MTRYREIADDLRRRILQSEFRTGDRLPAEARLADEYDVSRGVVRNALAALQRRGLVASHPGWGWQVRPDFQTQEFAELRSFAQWAEARHLSPGGRVVGQTREPADAVDASSLRMRAGEDVLRVTRLRTLDGRPVMVERATYAPWVAPSIENLPPDVASVTRAMEADGITMAYGEHRIDTTPASSDDAELLHVRRSTRLLRVRRVTYAADGRAIEWGDDRYAPDSVTFEVHSSASGQVIGRARSS